jgi:hypothetical protein
LKSIMVVGVPAAAALTEILDACNSFLLSATWSTASPRSGRTLRVIIAMRLEWS